MMKILLAFLFCLPSFGAFGYHKEIAVDPTKVGGETHTDFPFPVAGTYAELKTTGNGGKVTSAQGYDVGFYSNVDCSTGKLKWEVELYTAASGLVAYWVKISSLSHTAATVIYMCYGDSGITTDQSDKNNTWNSGYVAVWHLTGLTDSTTNGLTLTVGDGTTTNSSGKIVGAYSFDGSYDDLYVASVTALNPTNITVNAWVKPTNPQAGGYKVLFSKGDLNSTGYALFINQGSDSTVPYGLVRFSGVEKGLAFGSTSVIDSAWHMLTLVYDGSYVRGYVDGAAVGTPTAATGSITSNTYEFAIGQNYGGSNFYTGLVDEFTISNIGRSAGWITAQYNSQNSPSTFYSIGSEVGGGAAAKVARKVIHVN